MCAPDRIDSLVDISNYKCIKSAQVCVVHSFEGANEERDGRTSSLLMLFYSLGHASDPAQTLLSVSVNGNALAK